MAAVRKQAARAPGGSTSGSPTAIAERPSRDQSRMDAEARRPLARLRGPGREPRAGRSDQGHDPHPGPGGGRRRCRSTAFRPPWSSSSCPRAASRSKRPASTLSSSCSRMGITKGKWSTLVTELLNFKDLYDANAPLKRRAAGARRRASRRLRGMGLKDLCDQDAPGLSRGQPAQGAAGDVHRVARDGDAAGRCL